MRAFGGEGDGHGEQDGMLWVFEFLFVFVIIVVFLNLLIAIISATFDRVTESREMSNGSQLAQVVYELEINEALLKCLCKCKNKKKIDSQSQHLIFA
jgi:hypothetical protein